MAEKIYRNILIHDPDHAHSLSMLGIIAFKAGEKEKAAALIKQAIRKDPKNPSLYFNLGNVLQGLDKDSQAISCYKKALRINPKDNNSDILNNLANSLTAVGRYDEALVCYQKTLHTSTHKAELLNNIAKIFKLLEKYDEAIACYRKALAIKPEDTVIIKSIAELFEQTNQVRAAKSAVEKGLEFAPDDTHLNVIAAKCERREGHLQQAISRLQKIDQSNLTPAQSSAIHYELGRFYDIARNPGQAFDFYSSANKAHAASALGLYEQKKERFLNGLDDQLRYFKDTPKILPAPPKPSVGSPCFLIGFPRSGTTLLNQILDSHPGITTLHEKDIVLDIADKLSASSKGYLQAWEDLSQNEIEQFRTFYFHNAKKILKRNWKGYQLIDVHPINISWISLIWRVFPNAKIILAIRHPYDVCLSCFMQNFLLNQVTANFFSLEGAAQLYSKFMTLWQSVIRCFPLNYQVVKYENLVADCEDECRRMFAFLEIEWDDRVLKYYEHARGRKINTASYHQVSEPIYQHAKYRWQRYAEHLEPIKDTLAPFVEYFGYDSQ